MSNASKPILIALLAAWPVSLLPAATIVHDTQAEFDAGGYSNSQFDAGNNWLELTALGQTNGSGSYTSSVIYTVTNSTWNSLSWTPQRPYYKQLPNNGASESGYPTGNVSMAGNVLLMHNNESSGSIADSSGKGNNGAAGGGVTYGATGTFNTALSFDGTNDVVTVSSSGSLNATNFTVEAWVHFQTNNVSNGRGTDNATIISRHGTGSGKGYELGVTSDGKPYFAFDEVASNTWKKSNNAVPGASNGSSTDGRIPLGGAGRGDDYYTFPGVVINDGGVYKMWYGGNDSANYRIYYATSTNKGITWTKYNNNVPGNSDSICTNGTIPMGTAGKGDDNGALDACVVREDDGSYKMWYGGHDGANWRIYYATSTNGGVTWTKYDNTVPANSDASSSNGRIPLGTAGKGDDYHVLIPWVIRDNGLYRMWYVGYDGSNYRVYHATSTNGGLAWTKLNNAIPSDSDTTSTDGRIPLGTSGKGDDSQVYPGTVIKDGGVYRMWYAGSDGSSYQIYYAFSTDATNWTKHNNTPLNSSDTTSPGYHIPKGVDGRGDDVHAYRGVVLKDGATYRMWYCGFDGSYYRVYHAQLQAGAPAAGFSPAKRDNSAPGFYSDAVSPAGCLAPGTAGKGDDVYACYSGVMKDTNGVYKMWYTGYDGANWRIYYATSADGITWTKYNNDVPTNSNTTTSDGRIPLGGNGDNYSTFSSQSAINDGGVYKMWYSGRDSAYYYRIYYATSPDGITWTKYNNTTPADSDTTSTNGRIPRGTAGRGDATNAFSPAFLKDDDGTYKMWYTGYNGLNYRIYHATSTNGLDWTKYDNAIPTNSDTTSDNGRIPLGTNSSGDDTHAGYCAVIKDAGTYKMWYTGHDGTSYRIYHATSTNGLDWTKYDNAIPANSDSNSSNGRIPLGSSGKSDSTHTLAESVIKDGATYKMWYRGSDGTVWRVLYATSPDGLTWNKYDNDQPSASDTTSTEGRVPEGSNGRGDDSYPHYPTVIRDGGAYKMWYSGWDGVAYRIYHATSPDAFNWTKYNNAIPADSDAASSDGRIPLGSNGKGDDVYAFRPTVIKDGATYKMWYAGYDGSNYRIYYATSTNEGLTWTKYNNTIPANSDTNSTDGRIPMGSNTRGDDVHAVSPWVIKDGATYKMWYTGHDGTSYRIYYATSSNGLDWTKQNNVVPANSDTTSSDGRIPLGNGGAGDDGGTLACSVFKDSDGVYKMWYSGYDGSASWRIYYATSPDGLTWTKETNAIPSTADGALSDNRIPLGTSGKGDDVHVYGPAVIKDGAIIRIWYAGSDGSAYRIYNVNKYADATVLSTGGWHHIAGIKTGTVVRLYADGSEVAANDVSDFSVTNSADVLIGEMFNGSIDELAAYNRPLSEDEIADRHKRGAVRVKFQACSSDNPPDGTFAGPDGTASTYYSELSNNTTSPPSLSLTNVANNRRFQYKAFLETDNSSLSPEINSVTVNYTIIPPSGTAFKFK